MYLGKRLAAVLLSAAAAISVMSLPAFAEDDAVPVDELVFADDDDEISLPGQGIEVLTLKNGEKMRVRLDYTAMYNAGNGFVPAFHENGYNYIQFRYNAPSDGELTLDISCAIGVTEISVFKENAANGSNKYATLVKRTDKYSGTTDGTESGIDYSEKGYYVWDKDKELYSGTLVYKVSKGDNIIQIARAGLDPNYGDFISSLGDGMVTVTATIKKEAKLSAPTFTKKITVTWNKVKNATGYKFKYSTDKKNWKTITVDSNSADIPVSSGKTYYYKVAARNGSKTGSYSKVSSIKIG